MIPRIAAHNQYQVRVEFPYDPEAVKQIKLEIPDPGRKWDAGNKCWIVENDFADYASDIMMTVFGEVDIHPDIYKRIQAMRNHEEGK